MNRFFQCRLALVAAAAFYVWGIAPATALENPDAPDLLARFEQRMQPFAARFADQSSTAGIAQAGAVYAKALDSELNQAYRQLLAKLDTASAEKLRASQRAWLAHAKAETAFIDVSWTQERFGTSSVLSKWDYSNTLTKERTRALLLYLQNYQ